MSSELRSLIAESPGRAEVISVSGVSKTYLIYDRPSDRLRQFFIPRLRRLMRLRDKQYFTAFQALKDVSFNVAKGEVIGIVGRNGSGKSTLLQVICGTLAPSSGVVGVQGRVSALLELGSGFNPEFTGRDNVFLYASVLGLSKDEIQARLLDILRFADIGDFIDQPVNTYSSGMTVRLAFAVAINTMPDVLIVDEALAVGDEMFQRKCFAKLEQMRAEGVTILFVSHSAAMIVELCDRAILLDAGEVLADGRPKDVVALYQKLLYAPSDEAATIREHALSSNPEMDREAGVRTRTRDSNVVESEAETYDPGFISKNVVVFASHGAIISNPCLRTLDGQLVNGLVRGRRYRFCYTVAFSKVLTGVRFGMVVKTVTGFHLGGALSESAVHEGLITHPGQTLDVEFTFKCALNPAVYFLNAGVFGCADQGETLLHRLADAVVFRVLPVESNRSQEMIDFDCCAIVSMHE